MNILYIFVCAYRFLWINNYGIEIIWWTIPLKMKSLSSFTHHNVVEHKRRLFWKVSITETFWFPLYLCPFNASQFQLKLFCYKKKSKYYDIRVSKWWQGLHFWVNCPFYGGEISLQMFRLSGIYDFCGSWGIMLYSLPPIWAKLPEK